MESSDKRPLIGVDLGGTNMQIGVVSHSGAVMSRSKRKTQAEEGYDAIIGRIVDAVGEALEEAGVSKDDIACMGIGAPGPIDPATGVVLNAPNLGWNDAPLGQTLTSKLGIEVRADNDVNVAIWGEYVRGSARGSENCLGAWIGTGVGGGFVLGGELFYGSQKTAGEIGHIQIAPHNPPGQRSLEHNCSRTAVVNRIVNLINAGRRSIVPELVEGKLNKIKSKTVAEAYKLRDQLVVEVVDDAAWRLGVALGGYVTALSLDRIVLGGGLTEALASAWVDRVRDAIVGVAFPEECKQVMVVASELEDDAGVVGAALLARRRVPSEG